jgi:hypothetical protein
MNFIQNFIQYPLLLTSPCIDEIIGDNQRGFRHNRLTTGQIFCIRQILEKKRDYNETVQQLFIDFTKAYNSVRRTILYSILIQLGVPRETSQANYNVFK